MLEKKVETNLTTALRNLFFDKQTSGVLRDITIKLYRSLINGMADYLFCCCNSLCEVYSRQVGPLNSMAIFPLKH